MLKVEELAAAAQKREREATRDTPHICISLATHLTPSWHMQWSA